MSSTGDELRTFFEQLRDEGHAPAYAAYIDKLEHDGTLGEESAALLRRGDRYEIEQHLEGGTSQAGSGFICIFWPPRTG